MNTTKILTYLLYALLAGLILVAGYKACQMKSRQATLAKEAQELDQRRNLGYTDPDSLGTLYEGDTSVVIGDAGIDEEPLSPSPTSPPPSSMSTRGQGNPSPPSAPPSSKTSESAPINLDTDTRDGRYRVVAGSFTKLDGARREMERLIKMGYTEAEVGYYNRGKYAVVVVKRTDNLNEANRIVDDLERRGIDAAVIDRIRKK